MKNIYKNILYTLIISLGLVVLVPVASAAQNGGTAGVTSVSPASVTSTSVDPVSIMKGKGGDCDDREDCVVEPSVLEEAIFCTADAKICPDGTGVGRVAPSCEFAACPGDTTKMKEAEVEQKEDAIDEAETKREASTPTLEVISPRDTGSARLDDDTDGDGFPTTPEASRAYIKLGDIKGELKSQRPGEVTVVGSKLREAIQAGVQVRGWDPAKKEVLIRTEDVRTKEALTDYAVALLASSEQVREITVSDEGVDVVYTQPVKLFGFLSVDMEQVVDADSEGRVEVRFPWWSFFAQKTISANELQSVVEAEVEQLAGKISGASGMPTGKRGPSEGGEGGNFQTLSNIMKAVHNVALNSIRNIK